MAFVIQGTEEYQTQDMRFDNKQTFISSLEVKRAKEVRRAQVSANGSEMPLISLTLIIIQQET